MTAFPPMVRTGAPFVPSPQPPPASRHARTAPRGAVPASVVALMDDAVAGANAAWRAALVARDQGLPLHLLCVQDKDEDIPKAMAALLRLACDVRSAIRVQVSFLAIVGRLDREGLQAASDATLLVLPASSRRWLRWLDGARALRLLRRAQRPVLWVRRPASGSYRRVLAAIKLGPNASDVIASAAALSRDPRFAVLHVLDSTYEEIMRLADVPARIIDANRESATQSARRAIEQLMPRPMPTTCAPQPVVRFGHASLRILQEQAATSADLIVMGKRTRGALADWLRFGVAERVMGDARADVMVVPEEDRARLVN